MVIADSTKHDYIFSNEGCTQGDVTAMALFDLGIRPLIDNLGEVVDHEKCKQSWYADDSSAGGQLIEWKHGGINFVQWVQNMDTVLKKVKPSWL